MGITHGDEGRDNMGFTLSNNFRARVTTLDVTLTLTHGRVTIYGYTPSSYDHIWV